MTGREIKDTLDRAGVLPSKQLGQNFLIDPNMARWIVSQLEATADDAVVEVGPGHRIAERTSGGKSAAADPDRVRRAPGRGARGAFPGRARRWKCITRTARSSTAARSSNTGRLKFLGNLPYSCGGAILKNLLSRPHPFERAVVMLQKEVIDAPRGQTRHQGLRHSLAADAGGLGGGYRSARCRRRRFIRGRGSIPAWRSCARAFPGCRPSTTVCLMN